MKKKMPEYLSPGVYIEQAKFERKPIEGVGTSTAGFLGMTERGSTEVKLVTSFSQFQRLYGGYLEGSSLTLAVNGFFKNGGQRCYIGRVVRQDAVCAELKIGAFAISAKGPGKWGNRLAVLIEEASNKKETHFKLTIAYWKGPDAVMRLSLNKLSEMKAAATVLEVYDNISINKNSQSFLVTKVNADSEVAKAEVVDNKKKIVALSKTNVFQLLTGGSDGTILNVKAFTGTHSLSKAPKPDKHHGLAAFEAVDDINLVYVPDIHQLDSLENRKVLISAIVSHCENMKNRFAILDSEPGTSDVSNLYPPEDSKFAAFYYPWLEVPNPLGSGRILLPPGGHISGVYARTDIERGLHKAPANEVVKDAIGLEFDITKGMQDILNPRGVNVIRNFGGRGIRVWGARTTSRDPEWKYVNIRRLFFFLEESIEKGTQWVVFEPNDEALWAKICLVVSEFLNSVWRNGALMGATADEAFFVKCNRTTMTQNDIDNGRLIILVGIAPTKPSEFFIFRIDQFATGAS